MVPATNNTTRITVSFVVAILLAGCIGTEPDPDTEPAQDDEPRYREEVKHESASTHALLTVWSWATEPLILAGGNIVVTEINLASIDRPEGLQNATFLLEWDSMDPQPLFSHGELEFSASDAWKTVNGTSPLTLTINKSDWPQQEANLRFRAHDPDIGVAFYTWIELTTNMTYHLLIPEEKTDEEKQEPPRGSNRPGE